MRKATVILLYSIAGILTNICVAQAPPTIQQGLSADGIGQSNDKLIGALSDTRPAVRGLAAMKLAETGNLKALPFIRDALQHELDGLQRLNLATALDILGDPAGVSEFVSLCSDGTLPTDLRTNAAQKSIAKAGSDCASSVVQMLSSTSNPVEQQAALDYLGDPKLPLNSFGPNSTSLASALRPGLDSSVAYIRQKTAICAEHFMVVSMKSSLLEASKKETDERTKLAMLVAVKRFAPERQVGK